MIFLAARRHGDLPNTDDVVRVAGEQGLSVRGPGHGKALGRIGACVAGHLRAELLNHVLAFEIPNLDGWASGGTKPVPVIVKNADYNTDLTRTFVSSYVLNYVITS